MIPVVKRNIKSFIKGRIYQKIFLKKYIISLVKLRNFEVDTKNSKLNI